MINPKDYPAFDFGVDAWADEQIFVQHDAAYYVSDLWEAAKDLPVYEVPLVGFITDISVWSRTGDDFKEFCMHAQLVNKANLKYPIILTPGGDIADGRHRLAKALITGKTTIKIQRLAHMPEPAFTYDENGCPVYDDPEDYEED
jgi:hypothetical protein